jgi:flagella basal body P-ring formation protein FlgA
MSIRIATLVVIALAALTIHPAAATTAGADTAPARVTAPALPLSVSRDRVTVTDDRIRLADLFTNTGDKGRAIVETAPAAGGQSVFDVYQLAAIARLHGLVWQARSWSEKVIVERASQVIPTEQILSTLRAAVEREMGAEGRYEIEIASRDLSLTLPAEVAATINVENLRVQRVSGQFSATVSAPEAPKLNVSGRVHRIIEVPTLNRRASAGDVLTREDINWVTLRADRVNRNIITDADRIIGMTPTRTLVEGKAIMAGEVRAPRIIAKGALVIMQLTTPHMVLSSKGRAMEHGAKGDVIKVMNIQSKTVVEGEVSPSGTIVVRIATFPGMGAAQVAGTASTARR